MCYALETKKSIYGKHSRNGMQKRRSWGIKTIGCDLDDFTFEFVKPVLSKYNEKYEDNVQFEDIKDYHIHTFLKSECKNIFKEVVDDEFIYNLKPIEGAKETLDYLSQHYHIYFPTAAYPSTIYARDKLLSKTFEWYRSNQLIRCEDKWLLNLDCLGDDCLSNLVNFKSNKILMSRPWNEQLPTYYINNIVRFSNWKQIYNYYFRKRD